MSSGTEKRVRTAHLTIRLAPDERAALDAAAEEAGLTAGSYARQRLLGARVPRSIQRRPPDRRVLVYLLGQLGRIGNNLNQLARLGNAGQPVDLQAERTALGQLAEMRNALLMALGRLP
jgi:hypothetical protein